MGPRKRRPHSSTSHTRTQHDIAAEAVPERSCELAIQRQLQQQRLPERQPPKQGLPRSDCTHPGLTAELCCEASQQPHSQPQPTTTAQHTPLVYAHTNRLHGHGGAGTGRRRAGHGCVNSAAPRPCRPPCFACRPRLRCASCDSAHAALSSHTPLLRHQASAAAASLLAETPLPRQVGLKAPALASLRTLCLLPPPLLRCPPLVLHRLPLLFVVLVRCSSSSLPPLFPVASRAVASVDCDGR